MSRRHTAPLAAALWTCLAASSTVATAQESYVLFESDPVRPVVFDAARERLYVVNTPDDRLEIFSTVDTIGTPRVSVPVGLEPVAVNVVGDEAWVVNHLSDSVSIIDLSLDPPRVVRTLHTGDEPRDVVFDARGRAYVTCAHRGQNTPWPTGEYDTPGIGRADVWVFDRENLGAPLGGDPLTVVQLFGDKPRALTVSADGNTVYAAVFHSGNQTTTITEGAVCDGGPDTGPCTIEGQASPGGMLGPMTSSDGRPAPEVGIIVQYDAASGEWRDERERDWSGLVRFDLPDYDVFSIDASADTPAESDRWSGVGTILYAMAVDPTDGAILVANTEANNRVRFEGIGERVAETDAKPEGEPLTVRGHLHETRVTVIDGDTVTPHRLNPHLDYSSHEVRELDRDRAVATPNAIAVSADGAQTFVAAFGSGVLSRIDTAALRAGTYAPSTQSQATVTGGGPSGIALDEANGIAYVTTRFDNGVSIIDTTTMTETSHVTMHSPEPAEVVFGRPVMYDARASSANGEASCASCHVFGDMDDLAWDLGEPDAPSTPNPNLPGPIANNVRLSSLKGPMTTQTFRGMDNHGPMHWRGDRTGAANPGGDSLDEYAAFFSFIVAFDGLLGREGPISETEMDRFTRFALRIMSPPNPGRLLDNSLRPLEQSGSNIYFRNPGPDVVTSCEGCHRLSREDGFFGTGGRFTFEGEPQEFKVAHIRNMYQKVGMFGMSNTPFLRTIDNSHQGDQIRGFGFLHDGSADTLFHFFHAEVFANFGGDAERRAVEALSMVFDAEFAPIVGQQLTMDADSDAEARARVDLMVARAQTPFRWSAGEMVTECDLVAHGVVGGEARGWLMRADGMFTTDRGAESAISLDALLALSREDDQAITFTCGTPTSGTRKALDRDEDERLDGDERDDGTSTTDRPTLVPPDPPMMTDAGTVPVDGGGSTAGGSGSAAAGGDGGGGCGCDSAGRESVPPYSALLLIALGVLLARRRYGWGGVG